MKKTSKKLLSLFLAVVMIITSCSVGFTAFAADKKTDSYWSNNSDAKTAFESLNDLADSYVPQLLNIEAIKNILEGSLNMKVTDKTTISDVVVGASPLLLGVLGGSANKATIRGDSSPLADVYFAYLDDEDAVMDFYSLYKFCQDNKDKSGDLGKYASETFPKLDKLLKAYSDANDKYAEEYGIGAEFIEEYLNKVYANDVINDEYGGDLTTVPMSVLSEIVIDGTAIKDTPVDNLATYIQYFNGLIKDTCYSIPEIKTLADLIYYSSGMGAPKFFTEMELGIAEKSGMPLKLEGKSISTKNYASVLSKMYTFDNFLEDNGMTQDDLDDDSRPIMESMYNELAIPGMLMEMIAPEGDPANGLFYYEMCVGTLIYTGLYKSVDELKALEITDSQINEFVEYAKANFNEGIVDGKTNVDINKFVNYINSSECPFSDEVKTMFRQTLDDRNYRTQLVYFQRFATDGDIDSLKNFKLSFGNALDDMPFIDAVNHVIPSIVLSAKVSNQTTSFAINDVISSYITFNTYKNNIASKTANLSYKYADYAIPDNLTVEAVNSTLNSLLDEYLKPGSKIAGIIDANEIIGSLLESDIELYKGDGTGVLDDLWLNLYEHPIETIFKLLPTIDIFVDELIVPLLLNGDNNDPPMLKLYDILTSDESALLTKNNLAQNTARPEAGVNVGIGALNFDLNKIVPAILHWITGDEDAAYDIVGKYSSTGADANYYDNLKAYCDANVDEKGNRLTYDSSFNSIPKFVNIYAADKAIYKFKLSNLEGILKGADIEADVAKGLTEAITELATFAMDAIDEYIDVHGNDARYGVDYSANKTVTQRGLNNIMVALPQVLDIMGKNFVKKYNIKSDWTYTYEGKIVEVTKTFRDGSVTQLQNATLQDFKDSGKNGADAVLDSFVNILIGNWINAVLDLVNDSVVDKNNTISKDLKLVNTLLNSLGGFGEKSIITDILNGFFSLTRKDDASFTLEKQDVTNFNGFSEKSGFFLLTNIQYDDNGTAKGIIPFVLDLINGSNQTSATKSLNSAISKASKTASLAALASSRKAAPRTNYNELLTKDNVKAANELVSKLDSVLSSLLKNTSLNGFDFTSTDSILSAAVTTVSNYIGADNTNAIVNLLDEYLTCITGNNASGPVNAKKIYTSANLSNLVVKTYSLIEDIADNLLNNIDSKGLIADAICGIISPDSVGIRMSSSYSNTSKILLNKHTSWKELNKVDLKYGFSAGNKAKFYDGLGESLNGIATVIGFILTGVTAKDGSNYYSSIVYPIFTNISKATDATGVMTPASFNKASDAEKLVKGIITPVSNILAKIYTKPATFIINLLQGIAGILEDKQFLSIVDGAVAPINNTVTNISNGVVNLIKYLSPTLSNYVKGLLNDSILKTFPIDLKKTLGLKNKDVVVSLINKVIKDSTAVNVDLTLPSINWTKLNTAKTPGEALLLIYAYVVDTILDSGLLSGLLESVDPNITAIISKLSAAEILAILNDILDVATTPTEIYWTFSEYATELTGGFSYPRDVTAKDSEKAVAQLDNIVENIFPLLQSFGIDIGDDLSSLVVSNLYTNEILTTLAKALYGALDGALSDETIKKSSSQLNIDFSPASIAKVLTDKSYGATYSAAANTLKKAKSWDDVKKLDWGFKNNSSMAQKGFVNGLAAILRPFDDLFAILLANGPIDFDFQEAKPIALQLVNELNIDQKLTEDGSLSIKIAKGKLTLTIKGDKASTLKADLAAIVSDIFDTLDDTSLYALSNNGYENAVVPLLEAFMCDNVKTYKQYLADIKSSKDAVLLDILNPAFDLVNKILESPVDTITGFLPNLAYFIDNNGIAQVVSNVLGKIVSEKGVLGVLKNHGIDVDKIITAVLGQDLGSVITSALGIDVKLNLELMHLEKCNIQDIVIPLVNSLISSTGLVIPDIDFGLIANLGTLKVYKSAARNTNGDFTAKHVIADKGKVLVAIIRYIGNVVIKNTKAIKNLLLNIDAIKNNETIKNVIVAILDHIKDASKDDFVRAIFYFLTENVTDSYYDYTKYTNKDYKFSYGDIDADFMADFANVMDGSVEQIFALLKELNVADITSLNALVSDNLYTDNLVATVATGLYGAIEGVKINDSLTLNDILAKTDIDFSTKNVAKLLTDKSYGKTYANVANAIAKAGSWSKVKAADLKFGVKDRDSFVHALVAVLRPLYGVLDVIFNEGVLNLFDLVSVPGSNGYESAIVPMLEALGVTGLKTMKALENDSKKAYDNILLDVLNPVFNWLEGILDAPFEKIASILPSIGLFIANNGLIQAINNLLTPVSALLKAIQPIVDVNKLLAALGVDLDNVVNGLLSSIGVNAKVNVNIYDLKSTLKPVIGQDNIVPLINGVLSTLKIGSVDLSGIKLPAIDWFELASHGEYQTLKSVAKNTEGKYTRKSVDANTGETLLAVLRYVESVLIKNAKAISKILNGIDAIKNNKTLSKILNNIFTNISQAKMDDLLKAIFYFFECKQTDSFFDFTEFVLPEESEFQWGDLDQEFCETLPPMLDGLVTGLLEENGGLYGLIGDMVYKDSIVSSIATGLYGAIEGVKVGSLGSLNDILKLVGIDFSTSNVAALLTDEAYGTTYATTAAKIKSAGSWKNIKPESLAWGVTDRDSFINALCAVLRPLYGVLDVLLNDGLLNLYDIATVPGSDGYTSTIVPLLEAFGCYNIRTQYQYREDMSNEYDAILKDVLNPLLDKVEDLLYAPIQTLTSMLPNLALFFSNDGLLQIIDNLLTPVSALLDAVRPIVDVNELLDLLGVDINALVAKTGLNLNINLDVYDLKATLKPLIGADNIVDLLNKVLGIIKINGASLGIVLPEIDWLNLAGIGDLITTGSSAAATHGARVYVIADSATQEAETLIDVLRFVINTVNYENNYQAIVDLIGGLIGGADSSITDVVGTVLEMLEGDADTVILSLVDLLKSFS